MPAMRASILVLLGLVVLAVAAVLAVAIGGDPASPAPEVEAETGRPAGSVTAPAQQDRRPEGRPHRERVDGDRAAEPETAATEPAVRGLPVAVRVVDGESGAPVPFAEVAVMARQFDWASMSDADKELVWRFGEDSVGMLGHFGEMVRADAAGVVRFGLEDWLFLACEHGGKYGKLDLCANADPGRREYELKLGPDAALRVLVVGPAGQPLPDLQLGLRPLYDDPVRAAREQAAFVRVQTMTDAEGRATLHHLQDWVALQPDGAPDRSGVRLLIPGVTADSYVFDPKSPPAETVELHAPPTGEVRIRVLDAEGAALGSYEDVLLELSPPGDAAPALARRATWAGLPAGPGAARFPYVALGQRFAADASWDVEEQAFAGPAVAGQVVPVELRVADEGITFTGRLVDQAGQPLGRMQLDVHWRTDRGSGSWRTNAENGGRIHLSLDGGMAGEVLERAMLQQMVRFEKSTLMGELPFRGPLAPGRHELGDIVMAPAPLIAAGVVTVDGEAPDIPVAVAVEFRAEDGDWRDVPAMAVVFGRAGEFEVLGSSSAERHRAVPASHSCLPGDPVEFRLGERDLRLELRRGGSIRVEPLLNDPSRAGGLPFSLTPDGTPTAAQQRTRRDHSPPDFFEPGDVERPPALGWRGLAPGSYRLRLQGLGPEPIVDLRALVVPPGAACADARLAPLDLRAVLRYATVTVLDAEGRPVEHSAVVWTESGGEARGARVSLGCAVLPLTGPVDLHVAASGHQVERLPAVDGDRVVRLRALPTMRIALPQVTAPAGAQLWFDAAPMGLAGDDREVVIDGRPEKLRRYLVSHGPRLPLGVARVVEVPVRPGEELELRVWLDVGDESALVGTPARAGLGASPGVPVAVRVEAADVTATLRQLQR